VAVGGRPHRPAHPAPSWVGESMTCSCSIAPAHVVGGGWRFIACGIFLPASLQWPWLCSVTQLYPRRIHSAAALRREPARPCKRGWKARRHHPAICPFAAAITKKEGPSGELTLNQRAVNVFKLRLASCWPQAGGHSCMAVNLEAAGVAVEGHDPGGRRSNAPACDDYAVGDVDRSHQSHAPGRCMRQGLRRHVFTATKPRPVDHEPGGWRSSPNLSSRRWPE